MNEEFFANKQLRMARDPETNKWYFAISDIVKILTGTADPFDYIKKRRKLDKELSRDWDRIVVTFPFKTKGGMQKLNCADAAGIFRIIPCFTTRRARNLQRWVYKTGLSGLDVGKKRLSNSEIADFKKLLLNAPHWAREYRQAILYTITLPFDERMSELELFIAHLEECEFYTKKKKTIRKRRRGSGKGRQRKKSILPIEMHDDKN
jgi:prophage antirepressor-like protein